MKIKHLSGYAVGMLLAFITTLHAQTEPSNKKTEPERFSGFIGSATLDEFYQKNKHDFQLIKNLSEEELQREVTFFDPDSLIGFVKSKELMRATIAKDMMLMEYRTMTLREQNSFVKTKYGLKSTRYDVPTIERSEILEMQEHNHLNKLQASGCDNMDFEDGNLLGWTRLVGYNKDSKSDLTLVAGTGIVGANNSGYNSCSDYSVLTNAYSDPVGPIQGVDPLYGGSYAMRLGSFYQNLSSAPCVGRDPSGTSNGQILSKTFSVTASNYLLFFNYAVVLVGPNDVSHIVGKNPYFQVKIKTANGQINSLCGDYRVEVVSGQVPTSFSISAMKFGSDPIYYRNWTTSVLNLKQYIGTTITIDFIAAGCLFGGHAAYAYIDGICTGLSSADIKETKGCNQSVYTAPPVADASYSWAGPAGGIQGSATSQSVTVQTSGTYTVTITPTQGNSCSFELTKTFTAPPPVSFNSISSSASSVCVGGTINLSASATNAVSYTWSPGNISGSTFSPVVNSVGINTYTCSVTDGLCPPINKTITVTGLSLPLIGTASINPAHCGINNGSISNVNVSIGAPAYSYSWDKGVTWSASDLNNNLSPNTYSLTVKDQNGCKSDKTFTVPGGPNTILASVSGQTPVDCYGAKTGSAVITASGGSGTLQYSWAPNVSSTSNTANNLAAGTYTCTVKDANNCIKTQQVIITEPSAALNVKVNNQVDVLCFGNTTGSVSLLASGGTPNYSYSWTPNVGGGAVISNLSAGIYNCVVTDKNGCKTTTSITISEPASALTVSVNNQQNVLCYGANTGSVNLLVAGGKPVYNYLWVPNVSNNATAANLVAGTYQCTITDDNGCKTTQSISISEAPKLTVILTTDTVCFGKPSKITATAQGGNAPYNYLWQPAAANTASISVLASSVSVTVTDKNNCSVADIITTVVSPAVHAVFTDNTNNGVLNINENGGLLCFYDETIGGHKWNWVLSNAMVAVDKDPCFKVETEGNYCVKLSVENKYGCEDTLRSCVYVEQSNSIFPNVFSPNGDPINQYFQVNTKGYKDLTCSIYDRWGVKIYEWSGVKGGWDGKLGNGTDAIEGTYYWIVKLVRFDGKEELKSGFLQLVR